MSLGRGLNALITPTTSGRQKKQYGVDIPTDSKNQKLWEIPLSEIMTDKNQPRKVFDEEKLQELAESIKAHGILQPLIVNEKADGGYTLVAGERRLRAAGLAGLVTVPVLVKSLPDREKLEVALIENIQRADLNPIEEGFSYKRLIEEFGLTQQEVADKVGKSRPAVANTIRLLDLPEEIQTALVEGKVNSGQARALLSLPNVKEQLDMLASMLGQKITVRELEKRTSHKKTGKETDPNILFLEDKFRSALGTKVKIIPKGKGGTINITYYSSEELKKIMDKFTE